MAVGEVGEVGKVEGDWVSDGEGEEGEASSVPRAAVAVSVSAIRPIEAADSKQQRETYYEYDEGLANTQRSLRLEDGSESSCYLSDC